MKNTALLSALVAFVAGCWAAPAAECAVRPVPAPDAPVQEGTFRRVDRWIWCISTAATVDYFEQLGGDRRLVVHDRQRLATAGDVAVIRFRDVEPYVEHVRVPTCDGDVEVDLAVNAAAESVTYVDEAPGPVADGSPVASGLARTGQPDRREIFAVQARASGIPLAGIPSCDGVVPEVDDPTLADWVGYNLSLLEGDQVRIDAECVPAETAGQWSCDVRYHVDFADSPDPWTWGVRFRIRDADRSLVDGSLICTGGG